VARPNWNYIRVDVELPDDDKLAELSPRHRLLVMGSLVDAWAYCAKARTDGFVRASRWAHLANDLGRKLMVECEFAEPVPGGYQMHNYTGHQRSREQIEQASERGRRMARQRWSDAAGNAPRNAQGIGAGDAPGNAASMITDHAPGNAEAEAEADIGSRSVLQVPEADAPETDRPDRQRDHRDAQGQDLASIVQTEVHLSTGGSIDRDGAAALARLILGGRQVSDPAAYLRKALREGGGSRWLRDGQASAQPTRTPPPYLATGPPPPPEVAQRGAAAAKALLATKLAQMREPQQDQAAEDDEQPPF
jgi:hypothetical protein